MTREANHEIWLLAALFAAPAWACGGPRAEGPESRLGDVAGVRAEERSRCRFEGRSDREVVEVKGPHATFPNVRRVFAVVGEGEDRHRVLLCREIDTNLDGIKDIVRTYTDHGDPLSEQADADFDGKIDTWITFSRGRVAKISIAHGGRAEPDESRFYVDARLSRAQRDTNLDGEPDRWEIYSASGKLSRIGVDLDFDGRVDRWDRDQESVREDAEAERASENEGPSQPPTAAEAPSQKAPSGTGEKR